MSAKPRIFISAVSKELTAARQLVANTLISIGYEPVWQDIFGTEQGDVKEMLRRKIDPCQGLIQLVGQRFGIGPTNPETDRYAVSYTQYELQYAREQKLKAWPIILGEQYPSDAPNDESKACRKNQKRYRESLAPKPGSNKPPVPLYHRSANPDQLKNVIYELRNDFDTLHTAERKRQLPVYTIFSCVALVLILVLSVVMSVKQDTIQLKAILPEYVQRNIAEAAAGQRGDEAIREQALLSQLEKEHRLPAGTLTNQLPAFARKLALDGTATKYERAQGAYAARDFVEAERLAVEAAAESKKALPIDKSKIIRELELAGWSANQRRDDQKALAHFTDASALTDKAHDALEWARVHHALAGALFYRGESVQAEQLLRPVISIRVKQLGPENPDTLASRNNFANALYGQGKFKESEAEHQAVLKIRENILGLEHLNTLNTRNNLANVLIARGNIADAEAQYRLTFNARESALGPEHPDTLSSRINLANVLFKRGRRAEAETEYRAVLKVQQRVLGPEHPDTLDSRSNLANALDAREGEAEHRAVLKVRERVLGLEHPETLGSRNNLAGALLVQKKSAEAEIEYRALIKVQERVLGPEHPDTLGSRNNLASALGGQGEFAKAEAEQREVLRILERILGSEHPTTLASRNNLANSLYSQGRNAEAEVEHRAILKIRERVLGTEHPDTLSSLKNLASALDGQDKSVESEPEHRALLKLSERVFGPQHLQTLTTAHFLALCLRKQRKLKEARDFALQAADGFRNILGAQHPYTKESEQLYQQLMINQ